jgi:molybdopterin synthase catalytic subunit
VTVTVLLFASLAEAAGVRRVTVEHHDGATVADVRDAVLVRYPQIERFCPRVMYAVNQEYASEGDRVPAGAEVAFIPPVSGG